MSTTTETKTYDNSGGLWLTKLAWSGNAVIGGKKFDAACIANQTESNKAPSHFLFLRNRDDAKSSALFRPDEEKKYLASGKLTIDSVTVLAFVFPCESESSRAPDFRLSFIPQDRADEDAQTVGTGRPLSDVAELSENEPPF